MVAIAGNPITLYPSGGDDTAIWAAAAAAAAPAAPGGLGRRIDLLPGVYTVNGPVPIPGPFKLVGLGSGRANQTNVATPTPGVIINCNGGAGGTGHLFTFPGQGYLWGGLWMEGLGINYTGAGNVFSAPSITDSTWKDMLITLTQGGSAAFSGSGAAFSFLNNSLEYVNITTTANVRTVPMFTIATSANGGISNTTFFRCKFSNMGLDSTQYAIVMACNGAGAYHFADNIRDCWFEHPYGGCYQSLSGHNITVDGCAVWDVDGVVPTTVAAASNGGTIANIATWNNPAPGVLAVASVATFPPNGNVLTVVTSGTTAVLTYTGISGNTLTGCQYVSGSGTVATGNAVTYPVSVGKSLYYFGAGTGGAGSRGVRVTGCPRNHTGPDGAATWDVECESTTSQVQVEGSGVVGLTPSSTASYFLNFHGCNDAVVISPTAPLGAGVNGNSDTVITNPATNQVHLKAGIFQGRVNLTGGLDINAAGSGLRVAEGANAKQGTATLAGGTVTVANTSVTASSRIMLTSNADGGTPGFLRVSARVAGTSFTITSSSGTDASTVAYQIFEPG